MIIISGLLVLGNVIRSEIDAVDHSRLTAFDVELVQPVHQKIFVGRKILDRFNLVAADKALEKSFVAFFIAVDDRLGGADYLLELRPQRPRSVNRETVDDRHFFFRKRKDWLRYAILKDFEIRFADVVDRAIVSIDDADVERDEFRINRQAFALTD